jgi:hypothetical protein
MKRGLTLLFALGVAAAGGPGCTGGDSGGGDGGSCSDFPSQPFLTQTSDAGDLQIALRSCPDQPPVQGVDNIQYTITDTAGTPQDGLTLDILPWMPSMDHGANAPTVTASGNGNYVASDIYLFMAGSWQLETTIKGPGTNDSVAPVFDIQ